MCSFLTVGVESKRAAALERALRGAGLEVDRRANPLVARLFPAGDALFLVTRGGCSCELKLPRVSDADEAEAKLTAKLRRKGYSATKLARALAAAKARAARPTAGSLLGVLQAAAPVRAFFHEVSADPLTEPVPDTDTAQLLGF